MKNLILSLVSILLLSMFSCSTGQSAFKKGNYYDATIKAVKHLRSKPDSDKSLDLVQKSYPMALDYYRQKVDQLSASSMPDKYMQIVETYSLLNSLADEIARCPAALDVLKPVTYFDKQLNKAKGLAMDEQFDAANVLLNSGYYVDARLALKKLEWVKSENPNYPRVDDKMALAIDLATLKTVVELAPEIRASHDINSNVFYYRMFDFLQKQSGNELTRFYTSKEAEDREIRPHEVLTLQFIDFKIGQIVDREKERDFESDSISIGSVTADDGKEYDVMSTVKAEAITYERELLTTGKLKATITDFQTGEVITSKQFPGEFFWKNHWATYNGDSRALPDHILELSKEKQQIPPTPQEMFLLLTDPLYHNASSYLKSYYRKK